MENCIVYENLKKEDIQQYCNLINNVFDEFVGNDYSIEGNNTFKEFIEPNNVLERFNDNIYYVAKYNNEIIGVLEIKNMNHISLFFVKKDYHKQGIGKRLFKNYIKTINYNNIKIITVNSSIYAEEIYSKLGFIKTNEIQEKNGIRYIPMEYKF
jgi:GNAT superfamily N-acetyltransferase